MDNKPMLLIREPGLAPVRRRNDCPTKSRLASGNSDLDSLIQAKL